MNEPLDARGGTGAKLSIKEKASEARLAADVALTISKDHRAEIKRLTSALEAAKLREAELERRNEHLLGVIEMANTTAIRRGAERDAALHALEIARKALEEIGNSSVIWSSRRATQALVQIGNPTAALAERDRAIREDERKGVIGLLTIADTNCEMYPAIQYLEREFNLEPKPEGAAAFFGTWPGDETDKDLHDAAKEVRKHKL